MRQNAILCGNDLRVIETTFRSKLRVEDMKEVQLANREATWASDKEVTNCKQCEKPFSVARRKVILLYTT